MEDMQVAAQRVIVDQTSRACVVLPMSCEG
jgi:hypothetical protein